MSVEFRCEVADPDGSLRALRADAKVLMRLLGLSRHELSVVVVGDAEIKALNSEFRNHNQPTDVLSFSQLETTIDQGRTGRWPAQIKPGDPVPGHGRLLGDVVISIETARKQSQKLGVAPRARLRTLLIHGILHLLGYDHERSRSDAEMMFAKERALAAEFPRQSVRRVRSSPKARKRGVVNSVRRREQN